MKIVAYLQKIKDCDFADYPPIAMEWAVTKGRDGIPLGKLEKKIRMATPTFDKIWPMQLVFMNKFSLFPYLGKTVFNLHGIHSTIREFAELQMAQESLNKEIKKSARDGAKEYYDSFSEVLSVNLFELMLEDTLDLAEKAKERGMKEPLEKADIVKIYKSEVKALKKK